MKDMTTAEEYFNEHRVIGDYLDRASVILMMKGFAKLYHEQQVKSVDLAEVGVEFCPECGNDDLDRNGAVFRCNTVGCDWHN